MAAIAILQLDPRRPNPFSANNAELVDINGTNVPIAGAAFDDTIVEQIFFEFKASKYLSGNITAKFRWYSRTSQTTGAVVWGTQMAALAAGAAQSVLTDALATANTTTTTVNGTAAGPTETTVTISNLDSLATDGGVQLRIFRDASNGADTMTGDAVLYDIELTYTIAGGAITNAGTQTDNAVVRWDGTGSQQVVQDSAVTIADTTGNMVVGAAGAGTVTAAQFIGPATALRETGGPSTLTMGSVPTNALLKNSGGTIIGILTSTDVLTADTAGITAITTVFSYPLTTAGLLYKFEFLLALTFANVTNAVTITLNFANVVTAWAGTIRAYNVGGTAMNANLSFSTITSTSIVTLAVTPAVITSTHLIEIKGGIRVSANGDLRVRLNRTTNPVVCRAGSYGQLFET